MKLVEHNANWVCKIMKLSLHFYEFHSIGLLLQVQIAPPQFASLSTPSIKFWPLNTKGLFTPESRAMTMKLWVQKKVSKGSPNTPPKSCRVVTNPQV